MSNLERLVLRTGESDENILKDCLESAKSAILARRFPCTDWPEEVPTQYADLQFRIALDLYNKIGAEGQLGHSENGVSRSWESSWVSEQLLREVVPLVGVPR
jgi:hypothetical protein